jgi:hypothetical protein
MIIMSRDTSHHPFRKRFNQQPFRKRFNQKSINLLGKGSTKNPSTFRIRFKQSRQTEPKTLVKKQIKNCNTLITRLIKFRAGGRPLP